MLFKVESFEKSRFYVFAWTVKTELFENDDVKESDLVQHKDVLLPHRLFKDLEHILGWYFRSGKMSS